MTIMKRKNNMKIKLTDKATEETFKVKLDYKKVSNFLHCGDCLDKYNKSSLRHSLSPHEAMSYELSGYHFVYPDGKKAHILVVWCRKCKKSVWDSRHLQPYL